MTTLSLLTAPRRSAPTAAQLRLLSDVANHGATLTRADEHAPWRLSGVHPDVAPGEVSAGDVEALGAAGLVMVDVIGRPQRAFATDRGRAAAGHGRAER